MIEIYHRIDYDPNIVSETDFQINESDYELVACVPGAARLGDAWNLSQNAGSSWIKGGHVEALVSEDVCRSSSIGDVFSADGALWVVLMEGYRDIEWGDTVTFWPSFIPKGQ